MDNKNLKIKIIIDGKKLWWICFKCGNPHVIFFVDRFE